MADEIKSLIQEMGETVKSFKEENDKRIQVLESKSTSEASELTEKVEKMNSRIDELETQKAELERKMARKAMQSERESVDIEYKARQFSDTLTAKTGRVVEIDGEGLGLYEKALTKYMRGDKDRLDADEVKALSVGSDPDGGYTVTPDMSGRIVEKVFETSPMRQVASVQSINGPSLEGLYDLDEAGSGWVAETGARTETATPELAKWSIPVHEQYANPRATQKLLDDSSLNMEQWLANKVQSKFSRSENTAFVNGDGNGKPRGFLTYAAGTTLPGTIEQKNTGVSGGFAGSGAGGDTFYDLVYALKAPYRSGARFACNRLTLAAIRKIKDSDGNYVWQMGLAAGQPSTIAGYPVIDFEDMPNIAANSLSIAFGNFAEAYQIVDRLGTRVVRDPYSSKPYIEFYTVKRVGGDVIDFDAIKLMKFAV